MAINLSGTWRVVYSELGGEMTPVAHFSGIVSTYKGGRFTIEVNGVVEHEGSYRIREKRGGFAEITYVYTRSTAFELDKPRPGIVQVTRNTFKVCTGKIGGSAPSTFNTKKGTDAVLTIHQKAGTEGGTGVPVAITRLASQW